MAGSGRQVRQAAAAAAGSGSGGSCRQEAAAERLSMLYEQQRHTAVMEVRQEVEIDGAVDVVASVVGPVDVEDPDPPASPSQQPIHQALEAAAHRPLPTPTPPPYSEPLSGGEYLAQRSRLLSSARPTIGARGSPPQQGSPPPPDSESTMGADSTVRKQMALTAMSKQAYIITVATGGSKGPLGTDGAAGTDANVFISLVGKLAGFRCVGRRTRPQCLEPECTVAADRTEDIWLNEDVLASKSQNLFEDGCNDVFELDTRDVGEIMKIKIGHDDTSNARDWHDHPVAMPPCSAAAALSPPMQPSAAVESAG